MKSYMKFFDLWDAVEKDYEVSPLPENPTTTQIKHHKEEKTKVKVKTCLFASVS